MIFDVSELQKINFSQVLETSAESVRKSKDGTKTFVKWETDYIPDCVQQLETKNGPYNYEEIVSILSGEEWNSPLEHILAPISVLNDL